MTPVIVSISPTAARSAVGTSWIAASGRPAAARPAASAGVDRLGRVQALGAAAQDRGVAGLQAERAGVGGDVRPALEDHADHPDRRADPADVQARGPVPFGDHLPDRVGLGGDGAQAVDHAGDARLGQQQPVEHRRAEALRLGQLHVGGVGGEERCAVGRDGVGGGDGAPRPSAPRGRRRASAAAALRLLADLLHQAT